MHATIEQLLAVRDREPVAAAIQQHVAVCLLCRETLDELILARDELNRLPVQAPPRDFWQDIQFQTGKRKQAEKQNSIMIRYGGLGLAASLLLAAALFINQRVSDSGNSISTSATETAVQNDADLNNNSVQTNQALSDSASSESDLNALITRSAQLEAVLHALPQRPSIVKASTSDLITGLQDGVALIDYQMNLNAEKLSPDQSRQLWQQRVDLMNSLVNVRYAETQRVAYSPN